MKYLIILADGMADYPVPALQGKTPLQCSKKPNMDRLAQAGTVGLVQTVPPGLPPGSDVANLSVLGYDPRVYYTGRSPLEAVSIGVDLDSNDVAFRCNLVTLSAEPDYSDKVMIDYSSDEISTAESRILINDLATALGTAEFSFYPGISYRHLLVWHNGASDTNLTPPHDISDRQIGPFLPQGNGADKLLDLMERSQALLVNHPVNRERIAKKLRPANSIWFWGQGKKPALNKFTEKFDLQGAVVSAVDLVKGLGICAGMQVIEVPGATGNIHTNFKGKANAALKALKDGLDLVYLHLEAPDEAGHRGELETKIAAIERIDDEVLGWLCEELPKLGNEFRIMVLPDHPTPLATRTHASDPVPFLVYQSNIGSSSYSRQVFDEDSAAQTGLKVNEGHTLMERFIKGEF